MMAAADGPAEPVEVAAADSGIRVSLERGPVEHIASKTKSAEMHMCIHMCIYIYTYRRDVRTQIRLFLMFYMALRAATIEWCKCARGSACSRR